ncbi:MAG: peptide-methionine (S)-S-oxide reductase MsrA [Alphaproteobacteria bacterium]
MIRRFAAALALLCAAFVSTQALAETKIAIFAGGCFWCMEQPFDVLPGVSATISGYTGGTKESANYSTVSSGTTGHYEAVKVEYDPAKVSYEKLLEVFWHNIDPGNSTGQFCDTGPQYRTAIFFTDEAQKKAAEDSKAALAKSGKLKGPIATEILPAATFYPAEDYHQDYYVKSKAKYEFYRFGCGRDARLKVIWGDAAGH